MRATIVLLLFLCGSIPASAHHSGSVFNRDLVQAIEGAVTRFQWRNPHVYIYVEAESATGVLEEWEIETDATPILTRSGWSADTLVPGDPVVVRMNPVYDTSRTHARLVSLTKADGSVWSARSSFAGSTDDMMAGVQAESIAGVWATPRETNAHVWSLRTTQRRLTEAGEQMQAAYDITTESPAGQCIPYPTPGFLAIPYLNEIEILDDRVTITGEFYGAVRTIFTDGRGHPANGELTNQGHSIGRWEGDELVVETTQLEEHRSPVIDGAPMGARRTVTERFRLNADRTRLLIDFSVNDPDYLAEPFQGTAEWVYSPHLEPIAIDCDPDVSQRAWQD